ncbi:hypothetical protein MLD38_004251 [Melastoma candidum]|uniref:Uncharacterized protein n=1 Tax=Melastoma candidum TaxID=119954 RepID=A0ACB9S4L7_9MYRT|nr:hypothetical protein MLD38_004251 [Melastoma candidum]
MDQAGGESGGRRIELPGDGFEWKKYGQKFIKSIWKFRAYYKCQKEGCNVKKKVEWSESDPHNLRIVYEGGQHNHDLSTQDPGESSRGGSSADANRYNLINQVFGDNPPS